MDVFMLPNTIHSAWLSAVVCVDYGLSFRGVVCWGAVRHICIALRCSYCAEYWIIYVYTGVVHLQTIFAALIYVVLLQCGFDCVCGIMVRDPG
jgi:hypothetical protein